MHDITTYKFNKLCGGDFKTAGVASISSDYFYNDNPQTEHVKLW